MQVTDVGSGGHMSIYVPRAGSLLYYITKVHIYLSLLSVHSCQHLCFGSCHSRPSEETVNALCVLHSCELVDPGCLPVQACLRVSYLSPCSSEVPTGGDSPTGQPAAALPRPAHSSVSTFPKPPWQIRIESMHHILAMIHRSPESKPALKALRPLNHHGRLRMDLRKRVRQTGNEWACFHMTVLLKKKSCLCVSCASERVNCILAGLPNISQSRAPHVSCAFASVSNSRLREGGGGSCMHVGWLKYLCLILHSHNVQSRA